MRVGYCRVSTKSAEQTASIETQAQALASYGCDLVLVDHGISGFRDGGRKGSAFPELIDLILDGTAAEVIVPNFDRTQRRAKWGSQLLDALEKSGCRLLELDTGTWLDPANNPTDVLMAQIRSAVQENESRVRSLKVRKALARRREAGHLATGKLPFGYAHVDGKAVPHPQHFDEARVMWQQLMELEMNISGWIKLTEMPWTQKGVRNWIDNPMLRGCVQGQWGLVEPVITWPEWERAKAMLKVRSVMRGSAAKSTHLFTGLVKCEACGKSLHNVRDRAVKRLKCLARHCPRYGQGIRVSVVRDQVIAELVKRCNEMAGLAAEADRTESPEMQQLRVEIQTLEQVAHLPGVVLLIEQQRAQLAAMQESPRGSDFEQLRSLFKDPSTLALATDQELRPIVIDFVRSIVWPGGLESLTITLR